LLLFSNQEMQHARRKISQYPALKSSRKCEQPRLWFHSGPNDGKPSPLLPYRRTQSYRPQPSRHDLGMSGHVRRKCLHELCASLMRWATTRSRTILVRCLVRSPSCEAESQEVEGGRNSNTDSSGASRIRRCMMSRLTITQPLPRLQKATEGFFCVLDSVAGVFSRAPVRHFARQQLTRPPPRLIMNAPY
jgi:hypothetical protein